MLAKCAAAIIINLTNTPIDPFVLKRATYVCETEYKKCLKKLIKKEERLYNAICGENYENGRVNAGQGKDEDSKIPQESGAL